MNVWQAQQSVPDVMPWGKHKGTAIDQVPVDYLRWVLKNAENATPELLDAIEQALAGQGVQGLPAIQQDPAAKERDRLARELDLTSRKVGDLQRAVKKHERDEQYFRDEIARLKNEVATAQAEAEVAKRQAAMSRFSAPASGDVDSIKRVVKRWYGVISRKFHPDVGGTTEKQVVANACYQELMKILAEEK